MSLPAIAFAMKAQALAEEGQIITQRLPRGLCLALKFEPATRTFHLTASRQKASPSVHERTVIQETFNITPRPTWTPGAAPGGWQLWRTSWAAPVTEE